MAADFQRFGVTGMILMCLSSAAGSMDMTTEREFDAAVFGMATDEDDPRSVAVRWAEPRKIRKVLLHFEQGAALPKPESLRVEYWHRVWKGGPDAVVGEKNAGSMGWDAMDDWTNGSWKRAETLAEVDGQVMTFTFAPTGRSEFPEIGDKGVGYRKAIKLRVVADQALEKVTMRAITDSQPVPLSIRIQWGEPAAGDLRSTAGHTGTVEVYNGHVTALRAWPHGQGSVDGAGRYDVSGGQGLEIDLIRAEDALNSRYDDTVVTVRDAAWPFSFRADEVAAGERILIDDLGVLVSRGDDPITLSAYRQKLREFRAGRCTIAYLITRSRPWRGRGIICRSSGRCTSCTACRAIATR